MIWYEIKELERLLITGKLSDKTAFNYLFVHLIFLTLADYLPKGDDPTWVVWVLLFISLAAVIWGVKKTYEINTGGDNRDYFKRFISLSFVAAIRTLVIGILFAFILAIINLIAEHYVIPPGQYSVWEEITQLFFYALLSVYYFYTLITSFRRINTAGESTAAVEAA
ncbi:hypothetical protein SAMN06296241_3191 [Salinimicrobium sediminis]|uniref:Uncharacterized protein n=1 Tax=Salinimicrobium sediminis TaxID=1343891 RepID=A0A285X8E8_9FLAO|nr:hypothetical protein [Salinimicrobium sediminis]SOC81610.1 hypothetical protein SAMN06296241_3191 [Salinimicrobium sediminis]